MNNELLEVKSLLEHRQNLKIDTRGRGKSSFLYVRSSERASEVSIEGDGFFVEYWDDANEESDKAPTKSEILKSVSEVVESLVEWLRA